MTISRPVTPPILLDQFLRYRSAAATVFWFIICATNAWGNTVTAQMDIARAHLSFADWEVASWEWSSSLVIFCLVPGIAWLDQRLPLAWGRLRSSIAGHVAGSVAFSLVHVAAMVAVRHAVYAMHGSHYDFGDPVSRFFYELIKDVRTYTLILVVVHLYHQLVLRAQGEASLLDAPDEGPALEPVERPTRFLVRKLGKEFLVAAADIERAQASGNYVNLRVRGRDYPLRSTIGGLETRLDPTRFRRVHRSSIVNLDHVAEIEPLDGGEARLRMSDGERVACSRRYLPALRKSAVSEVIHT
ncbi:MAG TPA: LytTR family DNA-binding domain-containing protein [Pinirhizobacter sp.]|uniref:LytTR family DNA-binding domain-containing protein n=1 Tax=Pinirhizobacter sp. TaxID=2950432 RepID=UPI002BCD9BC8|nr:LytTR family DNA-binding domain-containing protein [Pinirhizobacter sp.]HMH67296.1 LytTR family DNA-binding domain-containing protein [Pinirhizobacter sp.]